MALSHALRRRCQARSTDTRLPTVTQTEADGLFQRAPQIHHLTLFQDVDGPFVLFSLRREVSSSFISRYNWVQDTVHRRNESSITPPAWPRMNNFSAFPVVSPNFKTQIPALVSYPPPGRYRPQYAHRRHSEDYPWRDREYRPFKPSRICRH